MGMYNEEWATKEWGERTPASNLETPKTIKNSKLKTNSHSSISSSLKDTELSNLESSNDIPLITEVTDFLATEAIELAIHEMNDESTTPTTLDVLDYKPVSIVHLRNARNNKVQQKPLMVLFDTGRALWRQDTAL